jgi:hypothetical protein
LQPAASVISVACHTFHIASLRTADLARRGPELPQRATGTRLAF